MRDYCYAIEIIMLDNSNFAYIYMNNYIFNDVIIILTVIFLNLRESIIKIYFLKIQKNATKFEKVLLKIQIKI